MSLTSTNTYVEPTAGTSLNTARLQQNDNFRSILANFRSTSAPTSVNLTASGAALAIPDGMLYRSATTNALYIADSVHKKTARVGGNFTRVGIGARLEDSYEGLTANAATYEIGELVVIASADTGQTKHGSLHICAANAGAITDFIEIGAPLPVTTDINDNVTFTGQAVEAPILITTANVGIRTDAPQQDLHVVGNALITTNITIGGNAIIGGNLTVQQNVIVSGDISTASDIRLKANVMIIDNALSKVTSLEGVYYNRLDQPGRYMGVIAQQIESIVPEVVINHIDYKTVTYGNLVGLLIEAIKELRKDVDDIKQHLNLK
jgi:hypothetical protein